MLHTTVIHTSSSTIDEINHIKWLYYTTEIILKIWDNISALEFKFSQIKKKIIATKHLKLFSTSKEKEKQALELICT